MTRSDKYSLSKNILSDANNMDTWVLGRHDIYMQLEDQICGFVVELLLRVWKARSWISGYV